MTVAELSGLILALVAVAGSITGYVLSKRGQNKEERQQAAANELATRAQGFTEMEGIVTRLREEVTDLREENDRIEARGDKRLTDQKARCSAVIESLSTAVTTLQGVVVSEVAREAAQITTDAAVRHVDRNHEES